MARKIVDATELKRGDRIVTNHRGDVETVALPSTVDSRNIVTIHTADHDIQSGLPCPVKVENR